MERANEERRHGKEKDIAREEEDSVREKTRDVFGFSVVAVASQSVGRPNFGDQIDRPYVPNLAAHMGQQNQLHFGRACKCKLSAESQNTASIQTSLVPSVNDQILICQCQASSSAYVHTASRSHAAAIDDRAHGLMERRDETVGSLVQLLVPSLLYSIQRQFYSIGAIVVCIA